MKLFAISSSQMTPMEEIFLRTCPPGLEVAIKHYEDAGPYKWGGSLFKGSIKAKLDMIIEALSDNPGQVILISDIDLQFFNNCADYVLRAMGDKDILFQAESRIPSEKVNPGFMAMRCNKKVLSFWEKVNDVDIEQYPQFEMTVINKMLREGASGLRWGFFGHDVWAASQGIGSLNPFKIILHHANCAGTLEQKSKQLDLIRKRVEFFKRFPIAYYIYKLWAAARSSFPRPVKKNIFKAS